MSESKNRIFFRNELIAKIGLPENTVVVKARVEANMRGTWVRSSTEDGQIFEITNQGRQRVIHGFDFEGIPTLVKFNPNYANKGVFAGTWIFLVVPDRGTQSRFWIPTEDMDRFRKSLSDGTTVRVREDNGNIVFIGFFSLFMKLYGFIEKHPLEEGQTIERWVWAESEDEESHWEEYEEDPRIPHQDKIKAKIAEKVAKAQIKGHEGHRVHVPRSKRSSRVQEAKHENLGPVIPEEVKVPEAEKDEDGEDDEIPFVHDPEASGQNDCPSKEEAGITTQRSKQKAVRRKTAPKLS